MDLITGASGFIGRRLALHFEREDRPCRLFTGKRQIGPHSLSIDITNPSLLPPHLTGIERVFHCAGYAHALSPADEEEARKHWQINFAGTRNLIEASARAGVQRFIFLSSVKAMAEPDEGLCADEDFPGAPNTPYGQSKLAAEKLVLDIGRQYGMHVVVLRLSMVYGAGCRGNLQRMAQLVQRGYFPPLPETRNRRSMVHVDDVVFALCIVADDERAKGKTYILTGPDAPSGREIFDALRAVSMMPSIHWSVPEWTLRLLAGCGDGVERLSGRRGPFNTEVVDRLLRSAWYSSARIEQELNWHPQVSLEDGLKEMLGVKTLF
ncbi:MAG: NAD-dependent epimerase/dehydratase family protein [Desulfobulbus sp.]